MSDESTGIVWTRFDGWPGKRQYAPGTRHRIESDSYTLGREGDRLYAVADLEFDEHGMICDDVPWRHSALRLPLDVRGAAAVIRRQFSPAERVELLRLVKWGEAEP